MTDLQTLFIGYRCPKSFVFNFSRQDCSSQVKLKILLTPANFCEENKLHYGANVKIANLIKLKRHDNKRTYRQVTKDLIDQHWNSPRQYMYYRKGMKYGVENIQAHQDARNKSCDKYFPSVYRERSGKSTKQTKKVSGILYQKHRSMSCTLSLRYYTAACAN